MTLAGTLRRNTFSVAFLYSIPFGLLLYFNSSFLKDSGFSEQGVALLLSGGYLLSMCVMLALPQLLRRFGSRALFTWGLAFSGALYLLIGSLALPFVPALLLPVALAVSTSLYVLLDIFLSTASSGSETVGGRRGIYATLRNGAYIVAQLIAVAAFAYLSFGEMFAAIGLSFVVLSVASVFLFREFKDPAYERYNWSGVYRRLIESKNLRSIFFIHFLLRIFYSIMVVYTPIYLHDHIGIPFENLALVFAFMILPFLLLEFPIGRLEDSKWGEKEVLISGFLITAVTTAALAFLMTSDLFVWAGALFLTRCGAALLDIGSETYFFKQVAGGDSGEVSAFRVLFPLSYIVGPLLGAFLLFFLPLQYVFVGLGCLMLVGIIPSLSLKDTR